MFGPAPAKYVDAIIFFSLWQSPLSRRISCDVALGGVTLNAAFLDGQLRPFSSLEAPGLQR